MLSVCVNTKLNSRDQVPFHFLPLLPCVVPTTSEEGRDTEWMNSFSEVIGLLSLEVVIAPTHETFF